MSDRSGKSFNGCLNQRLMALQIGLAIFVKQPSHGFYYISTQAFRWNIRLLNWHESLTLLAGLIVLVCVLRPSLLWAFDLLGRSSDLQKKKILSFRMSMDDDWTLMNFLSLRNTAQKCQCGTLSRGLPCQDQKPLLPYFRWYDINTNTFSLV